MSGHNVKSISACFYHDDRLGAVHCNVCMKPLCEECVKKIDGGSYCSLECARKAAKALGHLTEINEINAVQDAAQKKKNIEMAIIQTIIVIVICFLFVYAWRNWIPITSKQQFVDLINSYVPFLNGFIDFLNEGKPLPVPEPSASNTQSFLNFIYYS